jgi:hypothetical protein
MVTTTVTDMMVASTRLTTVTTVTTTTHRATTFALVGTSTK